MVRETTYRIAPEDARLIFGIASIAAAVGLVALSAVVPSIADVAKDLAKIFGIGYVAAVGFYFGAKGQT